MPELPEVETIKNDLLRKIVGETIVLAETDNPKMIKEPDAQQFLVEIKGRKIVDVSRRAKNLLIHLDRNLILLIHLKMTGHPLVAKGIGVKDGHWQVNDPKNLLAQGVNQFIHLVLKLSHGKVFGLSDLRKFATARLVTKERAEDLLADLGPEPLESSFTYQEFLRVLSKKKGPIKKVLMDQKVIAGIGNIYADEILWEAKINPFRSVETLSSKELEAIYQAIKQVLKKAIELRGTSTSDYRDTSGEKGRYDQVRRVYRLTGEPCPRDGSSIERKTLNGRGTHFCPVCQV